MSRKHRLIGISTGVAGVVVVAFVSLPSWCRSRMHRGDNPVIGDMRTMISAQSVYAFQNGDYYDSPACLAHPSKCLPGWDASKPAFLGDDLASLTIRGDYARSFHPGPPAPPDEIEARGLSPSSVTTWAYVARPLRTGWRTFCADARGIICHSPGSAGGMPDPKEGVCPAQCEPLT